MRIKTYNLLTQYLAILDAWKKDGLIENRSVMIRFIVKRFLTKEKLCAERLKLVSPDVPIHNRIITSNMDKTILKEIDHLLTAGHTALSASEFVRLAFHDYFSEILLNDHERIEPTYQPQILPQYSKMSDTLRIEVGLTDDNQPIYKEYKLVTKEGNPLAVKH